MHARPDDERACAQQLTEIARDVVTLWDYLEVPEAARGPIEWYRYIDQRDFDEHGPPGSDDAAATAIGSVLHATADVLEHELVHAALYRLGHPPPLFTEGVAVALSCSPRGEQSRSLPVMSWRDALNAPSELNDAELVTHLLKEYPPETFRALYDALGNDPAADEVATTFLAHYGTSLDDVWTQVQTDPSRAYCFPFWACQGPLSEPGSHELGATCGSARSALRLADDTALLLAAEAGVATLRPCDAISADGLLEHALMLGQADTLFFPASKSFAAQRFSADNAVVSFEPVLGQFASNCKAAVPQRIDPSDHDRELYVPPMQQPVFLAYEVSEPAVVSWRGNHQSLIAGEDPWTIEACLDCQDGQLLNCSAPFRSLEVMDRVWLKIAWEANPEQETLLAKLSFRPMTRE